MPRSRRRTVQFEPVQLVPYYKKKWTGPEALQLPALQTVREEDEETITTVPLCRPVHNSDLAMYLARLPQGAKLLPGWTGFNVQLEEGKGTQGKGSVGYLPVINGPPTELTTVNAVFERSLAIAN